ncbi:MAG: tetratricopeptide repeat protein, partial [Planctomycetes bacterium]|nr:tetratricopeptide repeat protein [Planctomycetota bacterium]
MIMQWMNIVPNDRKGNTRESAPFTGGVQERASDRSPPNISIPESVAQSLRLAFAMTAWLLLPSIGFYQASASEPALTPAQQERLNLLSQYHQQTEKLIQDGNFRDAASAANKKLAIFREIVGNEIDQLAEVLLQVAEIHAQAENFESARKLFEECLSACQMQNGNDDWRVTEASLRLMDIDFMEKCSVEDRAAIRGAYVANKQAIRLYQAGRYSEAITHQKSSHNVHIRIFGPSHLLTSASSYNLAVIYREQGNLAAAEPLLELALGIQEKILGHDDLRTLPCLIALANLYKSQGKQIAAEPLLRRAKETRDKYDQQISKLWQDGKLLKALSEAGRKLSVERAAFGNKHENVVSSLWNLADMKETIGDFDEARKLKDEALTAQIGVYGSGDWRATNARLARDDVTLREMLSPDDRKTLHEAYKLHKRADELDRAGQHGDAMEIAARVRGVYERFLGLTHPATARILLDLAELYTEEGDYASAEPLCRRALEIREGTLGRNHPETALSLNSVATLYALQGNFAAAIHHSRLALDVSEDALGPGDPQTALVLRNLGMMFLAQGNDTAAESHLQQGLEIIQKLPNREDLLESNFLAPLAEVFAKKGNSAAAELLNQRNLKFLEENLGPEHPDTAICVFALAKLFGAQRNYKLAETFYARGLKIYETSFGPDHPDTAKMLYNLALVKWWQSEVDEAQELTSRGLKIYSFHAKRTANIQTEHQQLLMAGETGRLMDGWLTFTSGDTEQTALTWRHVLAWKGQVVVRKFGKQRAWNTDPNYATLRQTTQQWSTLTLNRPAPPS